MKKKVDHLVYAVPNLEAGIAHMEHLTGVRAVSGGFHPNWATRNALLSLGPQVYLEIIGPDPEQAAGQKPAVFQLAELSAPRLVTWAAQSSRLKEQTALAATSGLTLGDILQGSRKKPDGKLLRWRFTDPTVTNGDGLIPFLINWGESAHPADTAPKGCILTELRAEHPEPESISNQLKILDLYLPVTKGNRPRLLALMDTPRGLITLE